MKRTKLIEETIEREMSKTISRLQVDFPEIDNFNYNYTLNISKIRDNALSTLSALSTKSHSP